MITLLDVIAEVVADVREQPKQALTGTETFEDLHIDSLGVLMVLIGVGTELELEADIDDDKIVELIQGITCVQDVLDYVSANSG